MTAWDIDPNGYLPLYRELFQRLSSARSRRRQRRLVRNRAAPGAAAPAGCCS